MAIYVVPQVLVFQDFNLTPQADRRDLLAFICGGHAYLARCAEAAEATNLGTYDHVSDVCYAWPLKPAGSVIDLTYTKLVIKNALLRYRLDASGTLTKSDTNKLHSPSFNFLTNPANAILYPRNAALLDRDVQVGDTVKVVGSNGSEAVTLCTYVKDIEADQTSEVILNNGGDDANADATNLHSSSFKSGGPDNCVDLTSVTATAYDGLEEGNPTETYTVRVTQSSVGGDATTARLRVISASGNDDDDVLIPAAFGANTAIGARGLVAKWHNTETEACSVSASEDGVAGTDFISGQEWTISVSQAFTPPVMSTAGSVYSGEDDKTYIVTVSKGGTYGASGPQITVTTDNGTDVSGPTTVVAANTSVAIGTKGLLAKWNQSKLSKGDRYYIQVTSRADGPFRTLVLGHDLDADMALDDAGAGIELSLYIKKDLDVGERRTQAAPQVNWTHSDTEFCIKSGIQGYDATWTDDGVQQPLDVVADAGCDDTNQLCVEFRAWQSSLATGVQSISDVADLDLLIPGALDPDNELKWAVFKALQNANGQEVKFMAVADPTDSAEWIKVLDKIEDRTDVYGLVPLTQDQTILGLFQAHVDAQSTEIAGRWRALWVSLTDTATQVVVSAANSQDGLAVKATIGDDADTSGVQYTILKVPAGNGNFVANGVRPGDSVRYLFTTNGYGDESYSSFEIDAIVNEDTLRLVNGPSVAESLPQKMEVWRTLTSTERAEALATKAGNWANRRIRAVWPDELGSGGIVMKGYHLCAALAALSGGVVPQQGLTHLEIQGFDDVSRTVQDFNRTQLNIMAGSGVWIVTQDDTGAIITRHALTTSNVDLNRELEMITRNLDSISYQFLDQFSPYIGRANAVPGILDILEAEAKARIQFLRSANFTQMLGGQIVDAEITDIRISPIFKNRVVIALAVTLPVELDNIALHLVV